MNTQYRLFTRYLDTNGTGTGTKNANGDYSTVADEWLFIPSDPASVHRLLVSAEDTAGMQSEEYGNLGAALTNGIELEVRDSSDNVLVDLTDGVAITTNAQWAAVCYDVDVKSWGSGNELLTVRWTFARHGRPLDLDDGDKLVVKLNDNFTGLLSHYFVVQGYFG